VLEEGAEVPVTLPEGFVLDDRREYGAAAVHVLSVS
jgi:16S rRNA (guanine966-N2)-methyltransferase